jgi:hypothetical protein
MARLVYSIRSNTSADQSQNRAVCGYGEGQWVKDTFGGRPIQEVIYRKPEGGLEMVLLAYLDGSFSSAGGVIIAFDTPDLDAFQARVLCAGGAVADAIRNLEFNGNKMRIAFFTDPDGYPLEVMQR